MYPDAEKEGSPLYKRMAEIHAIMEANGDDTIHHPQKALLIAQMAARELRIAPRAVTAPSSPPAQRTATTRARGVAPMTAPLAPRGARTTAPAANPWKKQSQASARLRITANLCAKSAFEPNNNENNPFLDT
jgi:hypothetical protein